MTNRFPGRGKIQYQFATYGNKLDFLINDGKTKMVVDAKYKPIYIYGKNHNDIRQVSGYARLEKVYHDLQVGEERLIPCLIIYPDVENGCSAEEFCKKDLMAYRVSGYKQVFKTGIKLPSRCTDEPRLQNHPVAN